MSSVRSDSLPMLVVLVAGLVLFIITPWTLSMVTVSQSVKVHSKSLPASASASSSSLVFVFTASISQFAVFFSVCFTIYLDIADAAAAAASIDWQSKAEILRVAFVWFRCEHLCEHSFTTSSSLALLGRLPRSNFRGSVIEFISKEKACCTVGCLTWSP